MKLKEKIKRKLKPWTVDMTDDISDSILSLIQQEVSECIGEDEKSVWKHDVFIETVVRNQLRSDIKEKLKQKGIL